MKRLYICIPYTKIDKEESFKTANAIAAYYTNQGNCVFSPITHGHSIVQEHNLPQGFKYWGKACFEFIVWCDVLVVVKLEGWKESDGVQAEIVIAKRLKREIVYVDPEIIMAKVEKELKR